jgi:hypothetical protein
MAAFETERMAGYVADRGGCRFGRFWLLALLLAGVPVMVVVAVAGRFGVDSLAPPLIVAIVVCAVAAWAVPRTARHSILFLCGAFAAGVALSWIHVFHLGQHDPKFGSPRGSFAFSAGVSTVLALVMTFPFATVFHLASRRRAVSDSLPAMFSSAGAGAALMLLHYALLPASGWPGGLLLWLGAPAAVGLALAIRQSTAVGPRA